MQSINRITILGNLTREPELKTIQNANGTTTNLARFSVATSTGGYQKQDGTQVPERTQFHSCTAWGRDTDNVIKLLHKGDTVYVEGEMQYTDRYVNAQGQVYTGAPEQRPQGLIKQTFADIRVDTFSLTHSRSGAAQGTQGTPMAQPSYNQGYAQGYAPQQQSIFGQPQYTQAPVAPLGQPQFQQTVYPGYAPQVNG